MNLNQLYYFKTLAELEHYTKASEQLNISQPTLSHSIASLERELGAELFERQGRNVVLTKYGKTYMFYVENALAQLELGRNQIARIFSSAGGNVSLAYMSTLGTDFMPDIITGFLENPENRDTSFSCYEGNTKDLLYNLKREKYDLVFCSKVENQQDVEFIPVYEQGLVVIVPEHHPLSNRKKVSIQDICPFPLVTYTKESGMRSLVDELFHKAQLLPNILFQFEDINSMAGMVAANRGVAIITDNTSIQNYNVRKLELDTIYSKRVVYMAYMANCALVPAVENFKEYIVSRIKNGDM
ncbi:MAG: LysR family transcriptional regulator [Bacillota bacterium]